MKVLKAIVASILIVSLLWASGITTAVVGQAGPAGPAGPVGPAGPAGADGAPGVPGYSPNSLVSGGGVTWTSGLSFTVSAATYFIMNTQYTSPQTDVTLTAAHATLDRIDAIVLNDAGAVFVVDGTPAVAPARPDIDPSSQLLLTFAYVAATATTPSDVVSTLVYAEDTGTPTEWNATVSGAGMNVASTNAPITGTVSILATAATTGQYAQFAPAAPIDLTTRNNLVFAIKSSATWSNKRSLQIYFASSGTRVGSIVSLNEGAFGFVSSNTTTAQFLTIPLSLFAVTSTVDSMRITVSGSQTAIGFRLDDIALQGGIIAPVAPSAMSWKGAWSATASYAVNDVVTYAGATYVAIGSSANSTPPSSNWAGVSPAPSVAVTLGYSGTIPAATSADAAAFLVVVPYNMTLKRLKAALKTAPSAATTFQVRRSTDSGANFSNAFGTVVIANGAKVGTADPADLDVNEGDVLDFSVTVGGGSGTNLSLFIIGSVR